MTDSPSAEDALFHKGEGDPSAVLRGLASRISPGLVRFLLVRAEPRSTVGHHEQLFGGGCMGTQSTKTELVRTVADIASAVAVVTTLGLLVASIRENTAVLRATAAAESRDSLASMNDLDLMLGEKHIQLMLRSWEPTAKFEDFNEVEKLYLTTLQRRFFRRAEAQYFRYRNGLLDEDAWQTVRNRVWTNMQGPVASAIWRGDRDKVYTRGFVESVESYRP